MTAITHAVILKVPNGTRSKQQPQMVMNNHIKEELTLKTTTPRVKFAVYAKK